MNRRIAFPALAILLAGAALRLYHLGYKSLWGDEIAQAVWSARPFEAFWRDFRAPPDFLLHFVWVHITEGAGQGEFWIRLPSAVCSLLAVAATWPLARRLTDRTTALVAMLLMAVAPFQVWYAQDARMYAALCLYAVLSLYFFTRLYTRPIAFALIGLTASNTLGLYNHLFGLWPLVAESMIAIGLLSAGWRNAGGRSSLQRLVPVWVRRFFLSLAATAVLALPLATGTLPYLIGGGTPAVPSEILATPRFQLTTAFLGDLLGDLGLGAGEPFRTGATLALALLGVALLLLKGARGSQVPRAPGEYAPQSPARARHALWMAAVWLLVPLGLLGVLQPAHDVAARYLIFLQPMYLLLVASGIVALARMVIPLAGAVASGSPAWGWAAVAVVLALVVLAPLNALYRRAKLNDWRALANYIEAHAEPGDVVLGERNTPNLTALSYFIPNILRYDTSPTSLPGMTAALAANRRIWYISAGEYFDPEGEAWARANLSLVEPGLWTNPNLDYTAQEEFHFTQSEQMASLLLHSGALPGTIRYRGRRGIANDPAEEQVRIGPGEILEARLSQKAGTPRRLQLQFRGKQLARIRVTVDGIYVGAVLDDAPQQGIREVGWELPAGLPDAVLVRVTNTGLDPLFIRSLALVE